MRSIITALAAFLLAHSLAFAQTPPVVTGPAPLDPELAGPNRQRVVLLTSIDFSVIPEPFYTIWFRNMESGLENIFQERFRGQGFQVIVKHRATAYDLWWHLHHPSTVGLFWLSHGAPPQEAVPGVASSAGALVGAQFLDVMPVFQRIHPNLRYLGIIGCYSLPGFRELMQVYRIRESNPRLVIGGSERTVQPADGLQRALNEARPLLDDPRVRRGYGSPCAEERGYPLMAMRRLDHGYASDADAYMNLAARPRRRLLPPVFFEWSGLDGIPRIMNVMAPAWDGGRQVLRIFVPEGERFHRIPLRYRFRIIVNSGDLFKAYTDDDFSLGEFQFSGLGEGEAWEAYESGPAAPVAAPSPAASPGASPLAFLNMNSIIYRYSGSSVAAEAQPVTYRPFACDRMPPRLRRR